MFFDNQGAGKLTFSDGLSKRTKHIDVKIRFIHEDYMNKLFSLYHVATDEHVADIMTKPLLSVKFEKFKKMLMIR